MNVDELNIVIKVDNTGAVSGIEEVIKKVNDLKAAVGSGQGNFEGLKDLASVMSQLASAGKKLSGVDFTGFVDSIKQFNKVNTSAFVSRARELEEPMWALGTAAGFFGTKAKRAGDGVESITKGINSLGGIDASKIEQAIPAFERLGQMVSLIPKGVGNDLTKLASSFYELPSAMRNFMPPPVESWGKLSSFLGQMAPILKEFKENSDGGATAFRNLATGLKTLMEVSANPDIAKNFQIIADAVREFIKVINASVDDADLERFSQIAQSLYQVTEAYNHLKTAEQKAASAMSGVSKWTKRINAFESNLKKTAAQVWAFGKKLAWLATTPFRKFGSAVMSAANAVKGFFQRFARLAMLRLMRMAIMKIIQSLQEGIKNLYAWSVTVDHSFAHAMDTIATAGLYFKNSIAAMFSPLIEAIAPILDAIVDRVVAFINVINQLFALLTGKTVYTAAIKGAKAYEDAAGGAAAAQEELNRTVLGFDELNRLNGPKGNGGGGGGGASGGEGIFEVRDISDLAERLFNDEDWTWLGTLLTDKLTEQMQSIDWNKIQQNVNGIATRISTFLNGAFGNRGFWETLGNTFGEGINTVTGFIDTFFQTTEWTTAGESFGAFLRNGIDTIDWEQLGRTITDVPRMITQWIHGFVSEWTVEDWTELGDSIADMVNSAFFNIDWATAIPDVVEMATGILHAINTAIDDIDWPEMFAELKKGLMEADWSGFWSEVGEFVKSTAPVWGIMLGISIAGAFVQTVASGIRYAIISAVASRLAGVFGGAAAGAGAAGATGGLGLVGKVAAGVIGTVGIIPIAVTVAIVATVALSIRRGRELQQIRDAADRHVDTYRQAFQEAVNQGLISEDSDIYARAMGMLNDLEDLAPQTWDTYGLEFQNEAEAIEQGLATLLEEAGYDIWNFNNSELKVAKETASKWKETFKDTAKANSDVISDMSDSITSDTQEMSYHSGRYIEGFRDKSNEYLSSAKTNGTTYIEELRKSVVDKLADAKTKGTQSIGDLTKDIGDKLSKTSNNVSTYGGDVGQKFADGISGKVSTVNTSVGKLADKVKGLNLTDSGKTWGGNTGSKYAEGLEGKASIVGTAVGKLTNQTTGLNLKDTAYKWGTDLGQKYADGINAKAPVVEAAAKNTADKVSKYLHFSEPDEGPLANFHTFAPDMMRLYAQGIEENKELVMNQLNSLTADMREVFTGVGVNYSQTVETNYDGLIAALADREEPINVYIGNSKLDTVLAKSSKRTDLRTGGR